MFQFNLPTQQFFKSLLQRRDNPVLIIDNQVIGYDKLMALITQRYRQIINHTSSMNNPIPVVSYRGWRYWVDILALWAANKIPVPIDPLMPIENIKYILNSIKPEFSLGNTQTKLPFIDEIELKNHSNIGVTPEFSIEEDQVAAILFTSGSTGLPKGVVLRFKSLMGNAVVTVNHLGMNRNRVAISIPFHFVSAISHFFASILSASTFIATESKLLPAQLVMLINQNEADFFGGSPLQIEWLAKSSTHLNNELNSMMSSGDHLSVATINLVKQNLPHTILHTCYGMTEVGGRCCLLNPDDLEKHPGSVGRPISGLNVKVLDENGENTRPNQIGEIHVTGHYLLEEYFNNPEATAESITENRFATGDIGYLDDEGYLYLTGRKDDVFKVNGQKVSVIPIQQKILASGKVHDAAVISFQHELLGNVPIAFLVPKAAQNIDIKELKMYLRESLPKNHLPQDYIQIDSIPRTGSGKIKRSVLKAYLNNRHDNELISA
jgi:long-chain acyl-CoA synthetase